MVNQDTLGELLINLYDRRTITTLQNLETPLRAVITDATDFQVGGNGLFFAVGASGDEGFGYISEQAPLPEPQNEEVRQALVVPRIFVGAVKITGFARSISSGDSMAFANGLTFNMDMKLKRMTVYEETVNFRDGTGKLFNINEAVVPDTTTAVDVDDPGALWLRRNMLVEIFTRSGNNLTKKAGPIKITDVDVINNTITLESNVAALLTDNDEAYLAGTQPGGAVVEREKLGLDSAISTTGTYLNIPRTSVPEWEGNVVDAGLTDIDEDRLLQAQNRILVVGGISMAAIREMRVLLHPNQLRQYFQVVVPQRQFLGGDFDAGYDKLAWNGHEFIQTYNAPRTRVWMGDFSQYQRFTAPGGNLQLDTTFGPPIKWSQGYDAGLAYFREYANCAIRKPNAWCLIDNVGDVSEM